ncbi:MAG: EpsG family protein, partial [Endomicrobia bacterium]|nr:EpsG family protein [Endomicrobiia bacterium]
RQYLAIGILMFAVQFIVKRSLWRYLALVFIAGTFHTAAFTAVILYFLYDIKLKKKYILTSLAVVALLIFTPVMDAFISLMQRTVFTRFVHYHEEGFKAAAAMNALVSLGIFSFIIITYRKYKDKIKMPISPDFLTWTSFVTFCIYAVSMVSPTFDRLAYIFSGITILGFSNFIMLYPARKRLLIIFTICLFFIICSSIFFIYRPEWGMPLPYRFFFQG